MRSVAACSFPCVRQSLEALLPSSLPSFLPSFLPLRDQRTATLGLLVDAGHGTGGGQSDLGEPDVERLPLVVERGRLQDDARRPHEHGHREDPQEEAVQHHGHVFPVLDDLQFQMRFIHSLPRLEVAVAMRLSKFG